MTSSAAVESALNYVHYIARTPAGGVCPRPPWIRHCVHLHGKTKNEGVININDCYLPPKLTGYHGNVSCIEGSKKIYNL